ncbi:cell division protein ZapE [Pelagivirga sediminicola]|uniref:Cell division protein ZapE n=1 Tax=Pelagivirga sediminicola TaxID=2170575 RepID=A0A2T7G8U5_9RHOB|nr:cell division protein ZapE [Pelagivirga sediminicola]PVA10826.1 cell division protein ZapE [Pelagivirga sediminicola]
MTTMPELYAQNVNSGALTADPAQEAVLPEFERIRAALEDAGRKGWFRKTPEPPKGLYMWGGVGRGKSMLMDMFAASLDVPNRRVHFHAFMQEIHAGIHAARQKGLEDAVAPVAAKVAEDVRLLAFDEMQITDITDAMIVGRLFQALFDAGVVIVTTSNRVPDDLYKNGLNRQLFLPFIELLKQNMVVHHLAAATDYRQDRIAGSQTYFTPINAEARARIEKIWQDLTHGQAQPHTLTVQKRALEIPAFHNGVARATFYHLCGRPLGAADYLALADAARVLVLEEIPLLSRQNFNEAKRFVTLIDALYEARVRLICSAAAAPDFLYVEGEGSFEFERTASRLQEMQSDGWGSD